MASLMNCEISQTFFFDAAHTLERLIETESSRRVHGHTYNAEVFLSGQPDPKTGMVMDLGLVRSKWRCCASSWTTTCSTRWRAWAHQRWRTCASSFSESSSPGCRH